MQFSKRWLVRTFNVIVARSNRARPTTKLLKINRLVITSKWFFYALHLAFHILSTFIIINSSDSFVTSWFKRILKTSFKKLKPLIFNELSFYRLPFHKNCPKYCYYCKLTKGFIHFDVATLETLGDGVVPAVTFMAHALCDAVLFEQFSVAVGGVLTASVGMPEQAFSRFSLPNSHNQCVVDQLGFHAFCHRPAHDLPRVEVYDHG